MDKDTTQVIPGDILTPTHSTNNLKLGPGLYQIPAATPQTLPLIIATRSGTLRSSGRNRYLVESNGQRYVPATQEFVVGVVTARLGEAYRVDIGSAHPATLDFLAFEGASKRNRPNLKVGSLIYARVSLANKDLEPELECFDAQSHKAEGFGELKGGLVVKCSLGMSRKLLDPNHFLLSLLGAKFPSVSKFEVAIGVNGRVWFKASSVKETIAIARCIEAVDEREFDSSAITSFLNTLDL